MTKKEIAQKLARENGVTQEVTKEIVQRVFDEIINALVEEGRIELRNFGVFEVKDRAARSARNPRTGESVQIPAKRVVTFHAGRLMAERVADGSELSVDRSPF